MAPRTRKSKQESLAQSRSTAAIFTDGHSQGKIDIDENPNQVKQQVVIDEGDDDPSSYSFPLNYIFPAQDFLNDHMNFCKFMQLLVVGFLSQVFYLTYTDELWDLVSTIGFNLFGVVLGLIVAYTTTLRKWKESPSVISKPVLPEFNLIYAFFLPLAFSLLLKSKFLLVNISLNYFFVENLHPLAQFGSGVMYYEVYNTNDEMPTVRYIGYAFLHYLIIYALSSINQGSSETETELSNEVIEQDDAIDLGMVKNKKSGNNATLTKTEIHLIAVLLINLFFNFDIPSFDIEQALPLIIFQKLIISLIASLLMVYPIHKIYELKDYNYKLLAVFIVIMFSSIFYFLTNYQLQPTLNQNAVLWLYDYIFVSTEHTRFKILVSWVSALLGLLPCIYGFSNKISLNSRRKLWHYVLVLSISYPALIYEPVFTTLGLLGSIIIFIIVEIIRCQRFTFLGAWLYDQLTFFQDFKDLKGPLNLSYIFLVVGVSIPVVYDLAILGNGVSIVSYIGIITLGLGDSFASVIGKKYGSIKWRLGNKSVQGTIAFFLVTAVGFYLVDEFILPESGRVANYENLLITTFLASLLEGSATLNDNFLIPTMTLIAFEIINRKYP